MFTVYFQQSRSQKGEQWMVSKAFSSEPGREWIVPNCVVKASSEVIYFPSINLSNQPLRWNKGCELTTMEKLTPPPEEGNASLDANNEEESIVQKYLEDFSKCDIGTA